MDEQPEIPPGVFPRCSIRRFFGIGLGLAGLFWLLSWLAEVSCDFVVPKIGRRYPEWAWQHGTLMMKANAADILIQRIRLGITFQEVMEILGPDSRSPAAARYHPPVLDANIEDVVSFNFRDGWSEGIDVYFKGGRVSQARFYD